MRFHACSCHPPARALLLLFLKKQELRDSAKESEAASAARVESASASAAAAAEEAAAARRKCQAVQEELEATRSVVDAADGRVVALSEELDTLRRVRDGLEGKRVALQLELGAMRLSRLVAGTGGRVGSRKAQATLFGRWRMACAEARQDKLKEKTDALLGQTEGYEVTLIAVPSAVRGVVRTEDLFRGGGEG